MKKTGLLFIFLIPLLTGCSFPGPEANPTDTPVPLEELIEEALASTQTARDKIPPAFPYSPAELAVLLEPGASLEGRWSPSTVTDITRPIPGYACSGYYGSCWGDWAKNISYGATLDLAQEDHRLGEIDFMYFDTLAEVENAYQLFLSEWSSREEIAIHPYDRELIGEQWLSRVQYIEVDLNEGTGRDPDWVEHLDVQIVFRRCHGFVSLRIFFPSQTTAVSRDEPGPERLEEQETLFDLAYEYMRGVDQRITPYACNP